MKTQSAILILIAAFQSLSWARAGEADLCQRETVSAAMQMALEENKDFYIVSMKLLDRRRDNDVNSDQVTLQLESIQGVKRTAQYSFGIVNDLSCEVTQLGGWHKAE